MTLKYTKIPTPSLRKEGPVNIFNMIFKPPSNPNHDTFKRALYSYRGN